jgi:dihydroorotate dehydrogenase
MSLTDFGASLVKLLPPEAAHTATIKALKLRLGVPLNPPLADPALETVLPKSGLKLPSPVGLAAGFDKNCDVPDAMAKFGFGCFVWMKTRPSSTGWASTMPGSIILSVI